MKANIILQTLQLKAAAQGFRMGESIFLYWLSILLFVSSTQI